MSVYEKAGQKIYFQREVTYGSIYDPDSEIDEWTIVDTDYPHWRRLDIIEDTFDIGIPNIEKLKKFDLDAAKHPSDIMDGNYEPVEITFDMTARGLEFLPFAVGAATVASSGQAMVQNLKCGSKTNGEITHESSFIIDVMLTGGTIEHYCFYYDVDGGVVAPSITGITDYTVLTVSGATTPASVATIVAAAIDLKTDVSAAVHTSLAGVVVVTADIAGAVNQAHELANEGDTGMIFGIATYGSTNYTITETVTTTLQSFTIHIEQKNNESTEDLVYDLFGCVVNSISINVAYGDQVATYSVTFKCPYGLPTTRALNPPPRKYIPGFPSMSSMQEAMNEYLIQEDGWETTAGNTSLYQVKTSWDRTPRQVDSVVLNITNNVEFKGDLSKRYKNLAVAGKREITLQIIGNTDEKELFQYFLEAFTNDGTDYYPSNASGRLNSVWKIQRDATYDYIKITFYNWILQEHNFSFVSVDDAIKAVDITLSDSTGDSNGRAITGFTFVSRVDRNVMLGTQ